MGGWWRWAAVGGGGAGRRPAHAACSRSLAPARHLVLLPGGRVWRGAPATRRSWAKAWRACKRRPGRSQACKTAVGEAGMSPGERCRWPQSSRARTQAERLTRPTRLLDRLWEMDQTRCGRTTDCEDPAAAHAGLAPPPQWCCGRAEPALQRAVAPKPLEAVPILQGMRVSSVNVNANRCTRQNQTDFRNAREAEHS